MMKLVWGYVAIIFGGALAAGLYFRAQERGWMSTGLFVGAIVATTLVQMRRQKKRRSNEAE